MYLNEISGTEGSNTAQYLMHCAWKHVLPREVGLNKCTAERLYNACASKLSLPHRVTESTTLPILSRESGLRELTITAHRQAGQFLWDNTHDEDVCDFQPHMHYNYALLLHLLDAKVREIDLQGERFPPLSEKIPQKTWDFWVTKYNADRTFEILARRVTQDRLKSAVSE